MPICRLTFPSNLVSDYFNSFYASFYFYFCDRKIPFIFLFFIMTKDFFDELDNELSGITPEKQPSQNPQTPQKESISPEKPQTNPTPQPISKTPSSKTTNQNHKRPQ